MKKILLSLAIALIMLVSCGGQNVSVPIRYDSSNNKDYRVAFLFEYDSCKVYRFCDKNNFVYFTKCKCGNSDVTSFTSDTTHSRIENHVKNIGADKN